MLSALSGKAIMKVSLLADMIQEWRPDFSSLFGMRERVRVPNHDERVSSSGKQHIQALGRVHEPNVVVAVAATQAHDDDITFFSLVII